jgi:Mg2+-importing ATPase
VAAALTTLIFVANVVLHKPIPGRAAVLPGHRGRDHSATTARCGVQQPGRRISTDEPRKVLVKRLVCIEDLGNVDVLFTDKTAP